MCKYAELTVWFGEGGRPGPAERLLVHLLDLRAWDIDETLKWSRWRHERNRRAVVRHRKRRFAERGPPLNK